MPLKSVFGNAGARNSCSQARIALRFRSKFDVRSFALSDRSPDDGSDASATWCGRYGSVRRFAFKFETTKCGACERSDKHSLNPQRIHFTKFICMEDESGQRKGII